MKIPLSFGKHASARFLGIDIGHDYLKVAESEVSRDGVRILRAGMEPTPLNAISEGYVTQPEIMGKALRSLMTREGMTSREAALSVSGSNVVIRPISVPRQKPSELAQSIAFEAQKWVSTTPAESYIETPILPDAPGDEESPEMSVLLVVAPRNLVDTRVAAVSAAGLDPVAADVNALANIRALLSPATLPESDENAPTVALVDLGASYTEVTIVKGLTPVLPRTINIGGTSFTNALTSVLGEDFEEAQQAKHQLTFTPIEETRADDAVNRVIYSLLEELVRDIRRSMAYYASTVGWENIEGLIERVILFGGGSNLAHTANYFSNVLQMNVVNAEFPPDSPVWIAETARQSIGGNLSSYFTAIGLSMWPLYAPSVAL
jgi:type IV pilus assembly protein PilM